MHSVEPPGQGLRHLGKESQNNVGKVPSAAGASSNLQRLLETRLNNRMRGEPYGIGTCARTSEDRGVMSPQEAEHASLTQVNTNVRQRGTGCLVVPYDRSGLGLIKPGIPNCSQD